MIDKELVTDLAIAYINKLIALDIDHTPSFVADLALSTYDIINKAGQVDNIVSAAPNQKFHYSYYVDRINLEFDALGVGHRFSVFGDDDGITIDYLDNRQVLQNPQRFVDSLAATGDANKIHELLRQDLCKSDVKKFDELAEQINTQFDLLDVIHFFEAKPAPYHNDVMVSCEKGCYILTDPQNVLHKLKNTSGGKVIDVTIEIVYIILETDQGRDPAVKPGLADAVRKFDGTSGMKGII